MATLIRRFLISLSSFAAVGVLVATPVQAQSSAALLLSPSKTSVRVGESFSISVYVSAPVSVNAMSARVSIPTDLLDITSVSRDGTVINFWVREPSFDRGSGVVTAEGVVLNPGYTGSRGLLVRINVRAKASGVANLSFASGSVLANDGSATNILGSLGRASVAIGEADQPTPPPPTDTPKPTQPVAAIITSPTHPDASRWYGPADATFNWSSPLAISGSNYVLDQNERTTLSATARYRTRTVTFKNIEEGVYYFHVRVLTELGWAPTATYKIQTDRTEPEVLIVTQEATDTGSGKASLLIKATDRLSGIDHFDISIDGSDPITWSTPSGAGTFVTPPLSAGPHDLKIAAIDKAGNARTELTTISVSPRLNVTLSLIARELCDRYCFNRVQQIIAWFLIILLLILIYLWHRRRWVKQELRHLEHELVKLEHQAAREFGVLEKKAGREAHLFAKAADAEVVAVQKSLRHAWLGLGKEYSAVRADRQLHRRYKALYLKVEKEILTLEEKKVQHGLTAHESHRLKELLEVLNDVSQLRHHNE